MNTKDAFEVRLSMNAVRIRLAALAAQTRTLPMAPSAPKAPVIRLEQKRTENVQKAA